MLDHNSQMLLTILNVLYWGLLAQYINSLTVNIAQQSPCAPFTLKNPFIHRHYADLSLFADLGYQSLFTRAGWISGLIVKVDSLDLNSSLSFCWP